MPILFDTGSLLVVVMSLDGETSVLLASVGETSVFSVLVLITTDPVHSWVSSNGLVERVEKDDFEKFICSVLTYPVRVEYS